MAKTLFSVGFQVMWESSVMKKQMQLQNRHSPYLTPLTLAGSFGDTTGSSPRLAMLLIEQFSCVATSVTAASIGTMGLHETIVHNVVLSMVLSSIASARTPVDLATLSSSAT